MDRVRWAISGTGRMASVLARELRTRSDPANEVVAVASRTLTTARSFAAQHGISKAYDNIQALAEDAEVDAVYVATPHSRHCEDMLACLRGRKAVLCEKPFTLNAGQAARVIAEARRQRVFAMEAMWTRFLPAMIALRRRLEAGDIGAVRLLVGGGAFLPEHDSDHYLFDPSRGGGVLLDAGVYLLSMASMILGAPNEIRACGSIGTTGVDEQDIMLLGYSSGAGAALYVSMRTRRAPDCELLGESGRIRIEAPIFRPTRLTSWDAYGCEHSDEYPIEGSGYGAQIDEVTAALRAARLESAVMPLDETLSIMHTMDAVRGQIGLRYPSEPS